MYSICYGSSKGDKKLNESFSDILPCLMNYIMDLMFVSGLIKAWDNDDAMDSSPSSICIINVGLEFFFTASMSAKFPYNESLSSADCNDVLSYTSLLPHLSLCKSILIKS